MKTEDVLKLIGERASFQLSEQPIPMKRPVQWKRFLLEEFKL